MQAAAGQPLTGYQANNQDLTTYHPPVDENGSSPAAAPSAPESIELKVNGPHELKRSSSRSSVSSTTPQTKLKATNYKIAAGTTEAMYEMVVYPTFSLYMLLAKLHAISSTIDDTARANMGWNYGHAIFSLVGGIQHLLHACNSEQKAEGETPNETSRLYGERIPDFIIGIAKILSACQLCVFNVLTVLRNDITIGAIAAGPTMLASSLALSMIIDLGVACIKFRQICKQISAANDADIDPVQARDLRKAFMREVLLVTLKAASVLGVLGLVGAATAEAVTNYSVLFLIGNTIAASCYLFTNGMKFATNSSCFFCNKSNSASYVELKEPLANGDHFVSVAVQPSQPSSTPSPASNGNGL